MGWESSGVVGFDLGPLLQGQMRTAKLKTAYNSLIIGQMRTAKLKTAYNSLIIGVNQHIGNHGLGVFWCRRIRPWAPSFKVKQG